MSRSHSEIFRRLYRPLEPIPTGEKPVLAGLSGIRAVLFDLYGTLFISASGEVGTSCLEQGDEAALAAALEAVGIHPIGPIHLGAGCLEDAIKASHAESHTAGIKHPEVDIVEIWRKVVAELSSRGVLEQRSWEDAELERLAVEFEARANPVWPMPGATECLQALRQRGMILGIISNAQFYSPELFPALLGDRAEAWGVDSDLQYYSYRYGRAKPGLELFRAAAETLGNRGIEPGQVLYVGNDMLNDIFPAFKLGFRTALFAGDARSLRRHRCDPRLDGLSPDVVLTALPQLISIV